MIKKFWNFFWSKAENLSHRPKILKLFDQKLIITVRIRLSAQVRNKISKSRADNFILRIKGYYYIWWSDLIEQYVKCFVDQWIIWLFKCASCEGVWIVLAKISFFVDTPFLLFWMSSSRSTKLRTTFFLLLIGLSWVLFGI